MVRQKQDLGRKGLLKKTCASKTVSSCASSNRKVNYKEDNCIFCQRKVSCSDHKSVKASQQINDIARGLLKVQAVPLPRKPVVAQGFLSTLNFVWPYLQSGNGRKGGKNQDGINFDDVIKGEKRKCSEIPRKESVTFSEPPAVCQQCTEKVKKLESLMEAVRSQVEVLLRIVVESKGEGRRPSQAKLSGSNYLKGPQDDARDNLNVGERTLELSSDANWSTVEAESGLSSPMFADFDVPKLETQSDADCEDFDMYPEMKIHNVHSSKELHDHGNNIKSEEEYDDDSDEWPWCSEDEESIKVNDSDSNETPEVDPLGDHKSASATEMGNPSSSGRNKRKHIRDVSIPDKQFKCLECPPGVSFKSKPGLGFHRKKCHPEIYAPFKCSCGESFLKKCQMREHFVTSKKHAEEEIPERGTTQTCDMCNAPVSFKNMLEHIRTHVGDYALQCPNTSCHFAFTNSYVLGCHVRKNKKCKRAALGKGKLGYSCETCGFKTDQRLRMRSHVMQLHERAPEKPFSCPLPGCDKVFCTRQSVDFHLTFHSLKPVTSQKCKHCSEMISVDKLPDHLKLYHQVQDIFICQQCHLVFFQRDSLLQHYYVHRYDGLFCDICNDGVKYSRYSEFCNHYADAHQVECRHVFCSICSRRFMTQRNLQVHMNCRHKNSGISATLSDSKDNMSSKMTESLPINKTKYTCELCFNSVTFSTLPLLIRHKIRVHLEEPFRCGTCDATFDLKLELDRHEKQHDGIKIQTEFKCKVSNCEKTFTKKNLLRKHMTRVHLKERVYKCDLCEKSFFHKQELKHHHDRTHLGLRRFICDQAWKIFQGPEISCDPGPKFPRDI